MVNASKNRRLTQICITLFLIVGGLTLYDTRPLDTQDLGTNEAEREEKNLSRIKSSGIFIDNYDEFLEGNLENVTLDENDRLSLVIDVAKASVWKKIDSAIQPSPRHGHTKVYDPHSHKVIMFGGRDGDGAELDDTWTYDLTTNTWTNMNPTIKPGGRYSHSMTYDSNLQRVILFGGFTMFGRLDDTWAYDLATNTWTDMNPAINPGGRLGSSMVYDSNSHKVILFGGNDGTYDDVTWTYDLATNTWTNMTPTIKPSPRYSYSMTYDSNLQRVILFGGFDGDAAGLDDTWTYELATNTWTNMTPTIKPSSRYDHAMTYDSKLQRVILFGGYNGGADILDKTWAYNLANNSWTTMNPTIKPVETFGATMVYDTNFQKVIMFGGSDGHEINDLWVYSSNQHYRQGKFTSQLTDVEYTSPITGEISWNPSAQPVDTVLELQIGFSNTTEEEDFVYTPFLDSNFTFEGIARYLRYRAVFASGIEEQPFTPTLETVYFQYTLGMPDYMAVFFDYLDGNATLLADVVDQLGGNVTLLETTVALATQNVEYLNSLNSSLSGNITLLREIVDQLGIVVGDADYDGLSDLDELVYGTDLLCIDTDCDNLNDAFEVKIGTDPLDDDTDEDGYYDGIEIASGTDPLSADDYPGKETTTSSDPTGSDNGGGIPGYPLPVFFLVGLIGLIGLLRSLKGNKEKKIART